MTLVGDIMRSRGASDPHIYVESDAYLFCGLCHNRARHPLHWSREDDRNEVRRRIDMAQSHGTTL